MLVKEASSVQLEKLIGKISKIRDFVLSCESKFKPQILDLNTNYKSSARNLVHYLAIRTFDLRAIQEELSSFGISSIGHSERYTLVNLNNILHLLHLLNGDQQLDPEHSFTMDYPKSKRRLEIHAKELFDVPPPGSRTRIMVTMPTEAARNKKLVKKLLDAGMNCARINCSHDSLKEWKGMIKNIKKFSKKKGIPCTIYMDLPGPKLRTGPINSILKKTKKPKKEKGILLKQGDLLKVSQAKISGHPAILDKKGNVKKTAAISTTLPAIFSDVKVGESIWFDDGKIGGEIINRNSDEFEVQISHSGAKGSYLKAAKGINLPDTDLSLPPLTSEDLSYLPFIAEKADLIGYSFVRRPGDVSLLQEKLKAIGREDIGIILKIETWDAFQNFPDILMAAMKSPKVGVMIARGDLAIEVGWERISEIQEEILWLCEAAHMPVIWATQVLENLAKKGLATRSEITDSAMAACAECVMLNKGPYIVSAVKMLGQITTRMKAHHRKKMGTLRPLSVALDFFDD